MCYVLGFMFLKLRLPETVCLERSTPSASACGARAEREARDHMCAGLCIGCRYRTYVHDVPVLELLDTLADFQRVFPFETPSFSPTLSYILRSPEYLVCIYPWKCDTTGIINQYRLPCGRCKAPLPSPVGLSCQTSEINNHKPLPGARVREECWCVS